MAYLLDTDTCIFIMKKVQAIHQKFESANPKQLFVSSITVAELEYGVLKSELKERNSKNLNDFLSRLTISDFTSESAKQYGTIRVSLERKGTPIGANDLLIASIAKSLDFILVTNNEREFSRVDGLKIENWTKN
jgi:tRNA(fMet)-specific endonuclease VapC